MLAGIAAAATLAGCGSSRSDWPLANADTHGTRAAHGSSIDAASAHRLHVAWRYRFTLAPRESGVATATPVVSHGVVFMQDMDSNVVALRARDGAVLWRRPFHAGTPGPNGLGVDGNSVYGSTDTTVFSLDAASGRLRWRNRILGPRDGFVDVAPLPANGLVFTATVGYGPGTRPSVYALDEQTGALRWRFGTIRAPWPHPDEAGGGGVWQTPTLADGVLYAGTANPIPWGGSPRRPNGGAYAGPALYTDSLVALAAETGDLRFYDQVTPHDVRDHDFESPPIVLGDLVIGSGKGGRVIAWQRSSGSRAWEALVGVHRNDRGNLPSRPVQVCPGLLGGILTPPAASDGRVFVPVVDLCYAEDAVGGAARSFARVDPSSGRGELVVLDAKNGNRLWRASLRSPPFGCATVANDVVFVPTFDGHVTGYDVSSGAVVWRVRASAGINACPSVVGDTLYVAAGTRERSVRRPRFELIAYRL